MGEESWNAVQKRTMRRIRETRWDNVGGSGGVHQEGNMFVSSFFYTTFPENVGAKEMYVEFKIYGDIDEVVIPNKRDVRGMDSLDSST